MDADPSGRYLLQAYNTMYQTSPIDFHGKEMTIISPRGSGKPYRNFAYLNKKHTPTPHIYDSDGKYFKVQIDSHIIYMFVHLFRKIESSGRDSLTTREAAWYDGYLAGNGRPIDPEDPDGKERLTVSHLVHSNVDIMELTIEPWSYNRDRSTVARCCDRFVCTQCDTCILSACPHSPRCEDVCLGVCSSCSDRTSSGGGSSGGSGGSSSGEGGGGGGGGGGGKLKSKRKGNLFAHGFKKAKTARK